MEEVFNIKNDIALSITKTILSDIQGRYHINSCVFNVSDRSEINQLIAMFETWRQLVSDQLYNEGLINERYSALTLENLEKKSLLDVLDLRSFYMDLMY